jgi:hypothetical protein
MRLLQLILYFAVGYILWRVLRSWIHPRSGSDRSNGRVQGQPGTRKDDSRRFSDIKDAEYEDLNPPPSSRP